LHIGVTLLDILAGMLQDLAHHDKPYERGDEYSPVLACCAVIGGVSLLFALGVWWTDPNHILQRGQQQHQPLPDTMEEMMSTAPDQPLLPSSSSSSSSLSRPVKWYSWVAVSLLLISLLASWILFVLKLVNPRN
jgi:hypothetical protein